MYSSAQLYGSFAGQPNTIAGRTQWIKNLTGLCAAAGWIPREVGSYVDMFTSTLGLSPQVGLFCAGAGEVFYQVQDTATGDTWYVIDTYDDSHMSCINNRYIAVGNWTPDLVFLGVLEALRRLRYTFTITGTRRARISSTTMDPRSVPNFGNALGTSLDGFWDGANNQIIAGGFVLRSQASTRRVYQNGAAVTYGTNNDLEIFISLGCPDPTSFITPAICCSKRFSTYPFDTPAAPNGILDNGGVNYRTAGTGPQTVTLPVIAFANPYQLLGYTNIGTGSAANKFSFMAAALRLMDTRLADTQNLLAQEATIFHSDSGGGDFAFNDNLRTSSGGRQRIVLNAGAGFNNVAYTNTNEIRLILNSFARYGLTPNTNGVPWMGGWAPAFEPWVVYTFDGSTFMCPGQLWDAFSLYNPTTDPISTPTFTADGQVFRRFTKATTTPAFTLCLRQTGVYHPT